MASCASCAPFDDVWYLRTFRYCAPIVFDISSDIISRASVDRFTESVRIYVICPASYSFWATIMVLLTVNPSFREASCCRVDVVKGGAGDFLSGFTWMSRTLNCAPLHASSRLSASASSGSLFGQLGTYCSPRRCAELPCHAVILFRYKSLYLLFPLNDKPHRHRLHPSGRQCRFDFLPQYRRKLKPHYTVERHGGPVGRPPCSGQFRAGWLWR